MDRLPVMFYGLLMFCCGAVAAANYDSPEYVPDEFKMWTAIIIACLWTLSAMADFRYRGKSYD